MPSAFFAFTLIACSPWERVRKTCDVVNLLAGQASDSAFSPVLNCNGKMPMPTRIWSDGYFVTLGDGGLDAKRYGPSPPSRAKLPEPILAGDDDERDLLLLYCMAASRSTFPPPPVAHAPARREYRVTPPSVPGRQLVLQATWRTSRAP